MNSEESEKKTKKIISKEYKVLAKNSFYSFLYSYSAFFFSIITSFIIARIITAETWGFLIISTSYIAICTLFLAFLPPSLGLSFQYYITKYRTLKQNSKLKSFVLNSIIIRMLFVFLVYIISLLIFIFFSDLFKVNLKDYYNVLLILSPLIIINGLDKVLNDIIRALNRFDLVYYMLILNYGIQISCNLYLLLFVEQIELEIIALIILISFLIPFIINSILIFKIIHLKIKNSEEGRLTFRNVINKIYKYGSPFSVKNFIDSITREVRIQATGIYESPQMVTGYHIGASFSQVGSQSITALSNPIAISFTGLYIKEKKDDIFKIYQTVFHYILFAVLIITGLLFFTSDFFLFLIYGESYLIFSLILKIMLLSIIFNIQNIFFYSLIRATNKVKKFIPIYLILTSIRIILFLVFLIYLGIIAALIILLISNLISFFVLFVLNYKIFQMKTSLFKILIQYFTFFISLAIVLALERVFLNELNFLVLNSLNLTFFKYFNIFSLLVFSFSYLVLNIVLKIITKNDLENIETLLTRDNFIMRFIKKVLNCLKKITRK